MATPFPKFSFSGWNSSSLAPKINPASVPSSSVSSSWGAPPKNAAEAAARIQQDKDMAIALGGGTGMVNQAPSAGAPGQLVGTTNVANTNLPAWLQAEVDRLNAQDALRAAALGGGGGGGVVTGPPAFDPNLGVAAVTNARANYNTSLHAINEAARLQNLIQRRNQMRPVGAFGFNSPLDVPAQIGLDREIDAYRNVNLPVASGFRPMSGWVQPSWR